MLLTKCFRTQSLGFVYKIILYVVFFCARRQWKLGYTRAFKSHNWNNVCEPLKGNWMPQFSLCIKETLHQADFRRLRPCFELLMSVVLEVTVKNLILITHEQKVSQIWIFLVEHFVFNLRFFFFKQTHIWFFSSEKKRCYSFPSFFFFQNIVLKDLFSFLNNPLFGFQFGSQFGEK